MLEALGTPIADELLTLALTHRSYAYENGGLPTNERLEFLGDSVLGVVIFTGAIFATLLTLFVVPVIYGVLARFTRSPEYTARKIEEWEAQETRRPEGLAPAE